jgi:DNA-binding NtrC family response regulator
MGLSFDTIPINEVPSPPDPEEHRPVVLVVDDEIVIADTLAIILSKSGFAAIPAYRGRSALEIAQVIPPDLLLTDVAMPGMSGIELAIAMSQKVPDCKVLLFSGQSSTADLLSEARAAGYSFPVLTKPIRPNVLLACISRCLEDLTDSTNGSICEGDEEVLFPPRVAAGGR